MLNSQARSAKASVIRFDSYEADLDSGQLYRDGVKVSLRDQSFKILAFLLEHAGRVVTREQLRRLLWREEVFVDFENNLNAAVARLRDALGDTVDHPRFIETLPKRGYRFLGHTIVLSSPEPEITVSRPRLLVLPFVNLSGDPAQEYFTDAITEEVITALAGLAPDRLAVIARTTAMHYKGTREDLAEIAHRLNVDYVVEGGVRSGANIVITVQLIETNDQTHLFAKKFDGDLADVFRLPTAIARAIAAHVPQIAEVVHGSARAKRNPTEDLVAYNLFLQGRYCMQRFIPGAFAQAKQFFEQAVARDPQFALAYDALGELYWWIGFFGFAPPKQVFSAGLSCALRAIEIDNTLAETYALIAVLRKELDYNWPEVQRGMARALELNPASDVVRFRNAASGLMPLGRLDEGITELEAVLESDPLSLWVRVWLGVLLWFARRYDHAVQESQLVLDIDPNYQAAYLVLGQARMMQRQYDSCIAVLQKAAELSGDSPMVLGWLGLAFAQGGKTAEARSLLEHLRAMKTQVYILPTSFAWIHLGLGEIDEAFSWMERAVEERDPMIIPIKSYAFLDPLRSDPRFQNLLRHMNLVEDTNASDTLLINQKAGRE